MREAVRLAVRRCATDWTGKKPVVDGADRPRPDAMKLDLDPRHLCPVLDALRCSWCCRSACAPPRKRARSGARPGRKRAAPLRPRRASRCARRIVAAVLSRSTSLNYIYGWIDGRPTLDWLNPLRVRPSSLPQPLDRLGQRDVELAHVGGEQGDAERGAVARRRARGAASPRNRGCSGSPARGNRARPRNGAGSRAPRPMSSSRTARRVKTPRSPLR